MDKKITSFFGKCRFCLSKGSHRDIMKEYSSNGLREVYYDLFQECFNLYLCINSARSSLICSICIRKLRDANCFRSMVVESEKQLINTLDEKDMFFVNIGETHAHVEVKLEKVKEEQSVIDRDGGDENNSDACDDIPEALYESEEDIAEGEEHMVEGEAELLTRFSPTSLKPLPTRSTLKDTCKKYFKQLELLKGKIITAKSLKSLIDSTPNRIASRIYVTEKVAHVINVSTILENSNLTAFKTKRRSGYPCFYCRRICESFDQLQEHQETGSCKKNIRRTLNKCPPESLAVYVHVTEIKCKICNETVLNLNELRHHLTRTHKKKLYPEFGERVIPFKLSKLNEYECQSCGFNFETFGAIERHMNVHYRNYVCDQCGAGYVTKNRLKVHLKYSHIRGVFPCDACKKVFVTRYKYKSHVDAVHKMVKKNKCPKCPERFADYFDRHKHMVDAHGEPPLRYRCNVCDALFKRRYALSCHMKRRHLEVKDVNCDVCSYKCYTTTELKAHMVRHSGERTYECMVCKKCYARKKTLKEHMRIHNNDRRFVCVVCGQAFVQNCSLKGHMKAHHVDYINSIGGS